MILSNKIIAIGIVAVSIGAASLVTLNRHDVHTDDDTRCVIPTDGSTGAYCEPSTKTTKSHTTSSTHGAGHDGSSINSEQAFIEGMIPHHQEAIDTARQVLARGATTPAIKTLAEDIIRTQEQELATMLNWYATWYGKQYVAPAGTAHLMMRDLSALSGAALDRAFLEDMIPHHGGAVAMATSVAPHIEHDEIRLLADAITKAQTAEISLMRELLTTLP